MDGIGVVSGRGGGWRALSCAAVVIGILTLGVPGARAGLTVTPTTLDDPSASGVGSCPNDPCSLREAVNYVHGLGGGTVSLSAPAPQGSYDLPLGDLQVPGGVSIIGSGPGHVTIDLTDSAGVHVIMKQAPQSGATDTISGVRITGGKTGIGGGILSYGGLTIDHVNLTGNTGDAGGGIAAEGSLTITNSTIAHNTATVNGNPEPGGGVWVSGQGPVSISNTTIADNTAGMGGGIYYRSAFQLTLTNVTLADNHATIGAGGTGGNLYADTLSGSGVQASNTIIGGGTANVAGTENCAGSVPAVTGGTHDLEDRNQCGLTGTGDIVKANPLLGSLRNNGGTLPTLALRAGSPAIDKVPSSGAGCSKTDERGVHRPQGKACDMGAFEFAKPRITITSPRAGAQYKRGSRVLAAYSCSEAGGRSLIVSCIGTVRSGRPINTSTRGAKHFTVTVTDVAGDRVSRTVSYTIT